MQACLQLNPRFPKWPSSPGTSADSDIGDWKILAWTSLALALGSGITRCGARLVSRILPAAYLPHGIALNASIAALSGIIAILLVFPCRRPLSLSARTLSTRTVVLFLGYVTFWALAADGFRDLFDLDISSLRKELPSWGSGALAYFAAALWLSYGERLARVRRLKAVTVALAVIIAGATAWSRPRARTDHLLGGATATSRPPVIVVLVDTLRADHLSTYGYDKPTSPVLDRFALDAITFTRAYAQSPWTRPSCGAIFTGRLPPEIGLRGIYDALAPSARTIPEFLKAEGYTTAGIVSSVHVSAAYGFDRGFDSLDIGPSYVMWAGVRAPLVRLRILRDRDREGLYPRYDARELTDRAIRWLDGHDREKPFFLYLHYSDPHAPYRPAEDRWRDFAGAAGALEKPPATPPAQGTPLTPERRLALVARYDAEIAYFDRQFGRLLTHLQALRLYDPALIFVMADHGEEFFEHQGWGHGQSLFDELLRIPLMMKRPNENRRGERDDRLASSMDVLGTIREVLGARWNPEPTAPSLLSAPKNDRSVLAYKDQEPPHARAIYVGRQKIIQTLGESGEITAQGRYCLATDPGENTREGSGCKAATSWSDLEQRLAHADQNSVPSERVNIDHDTEEELRALGYIR
jgi:arylsulfatase A-like enzyme